MDTGTETGGSERTAPVSLLRSIDLRPSGVRLEPASTCAPALARAKITKPFRPWHDLRHTSLTHEAAAGNLQAYVQLKAGHSQGSITERYIHAAQVLFPGAASRGEERMFGGSGSKAGSN